ncbi:hypothetical protein LWC34_41725 [Kibdelosporangium philippinense]|uniref:Uncharacterized protein n=1 Tax=Kibdelosporangium philippinense TaxID=211113 RepID=A0ABS8ZNJ9_9PSEU|nr:hypothetical protein [Kibdelosporangium philippinense]MCE7009290.1 hypothetical protein [Kibdelosporangium philippinense]
MSRRLTIVVFAAAMALAGCSSSGDDSAKDASGQFGGTPQQPSENGGGGGEPTTPPAPPEPSNGDPVKWMDNLCTPISDFNRSLGGRMGDLATAADQTQMQAKLGQFIDNLAGGLGGTVARLKLLEPAPLKGGDDVKNKIISTYTASQNALKEVAARARAGDQDAMGQVMESLGEETSKMADPFKDNDPAEVRDAMAKAPRCKDLQTS